MWHAEFYNQYWGTIYLDAEPKAKTAASRIPAKNLNGFLRTTMKYKNGKIIKACMRRPAITVTMKSPSFSSETTMSSIPATFAAIRLQMPIGEYLQ